MQRKHTEVAVGILIRADGALLLTTRPLREPRSSAQTRASARAPAMAAASSPNDASHCPAMARYSSWLNG